MEQSVNQITLRGNLYSRPEYSHKNHDKQFYRFLLEVPRLSGTPDILPVLADLQVLEKCHIEEGCELTITGEIRSHNQRQDGKRHLMIFAFAHSISNDDGDPLNNVFLQGILCREPIFRTTPLGREICDIILAVPRSFRRSDYLPCIFWGRTGREAARHTVGDSIQLQGRFQSRGYSKCTDTGILQKTAYEISVLNAEFFCGRNMP